MTTITKHAEAPLDSGPPRAGDRFLGIGLIILTALFVGVQVLAGEVIPPLAAPALVYAVIGVVVLRRAPRWLVVSTVVLIVLHLGSSLPFLAAALTHPESTASFLPDALILVVALAVVASAVAGLAGIDARKPVAIGAVVVAAGLVVLSTVAAAGVDSEPRQAGDVSVETVRTSFPGRVEVSAGGAVLLVDNQDPFRHTLVIEGTDVHAELPGSTSVRVETSLDPGTYRYYCDVPGHERMAGELVAR
jgi:plastocyanin